MIQHWTRGHFSEANLSRNHDTNICWLGGLVDLIQPNRFSTVMPRNAMMIQHWRRGHNDDTTCQQKNSSLQQQNLFPLIVTPQLRNDFVIVYAGSVERGRSPIQASVLPPFCGVQEAPRGHNDDTTCKQKNSSLQQLQFNSLIVTPQLDRTQ